MPVAVGCGLWLDCWPYASVPVLTTSGSTGSVCVCKENGALIGWYGREESEIGQGMER